MPTTRHSADLTLEIATPQEFNLQDIFRGSVVTYQTDGAERLNWRIEDASQDELYDAANIRVDGETLSITALTQRTQAFTIEIWYFDDPDDTYEFNVVAVNPQRREAVEQRKIADAVLWGPGDWYELPQLSYFDGNAPIATLSDISGDLNVTALAGRRTQVHARAIPSSCTVTYGPYIFSISARAPDLTDDVSFAEIIYLSASGQVAIRAPSVFNNIPAIYKDNLALGSITYDILQGSEIVSILTASGDNFPTLLIGNRQQATPTGNYTVSIAVQDTATTTTRYILRFYVKVMGLNGEDPKNPFPLFVDIPNADPTGTDTPTAPTNPPPPQNTMYQNVPFPPPVRDSQLTERMYDFSQSDRPQRPPAHLVAALIGRVDQEGTATTLGLADPRRLERVAPQILSGSIYDVPKELPEDFWVEWPHNIVIEEGE